MAFASKHLLHENLLEGAGAANKLLQQKTRYCFCFLFRYCTYRSNNEWSYYPCNWKQKLKLYIWGVPVCQWLVGLHPNKWAQALKTDISVCQLSFDKPMVPPTNRINPKGINLWFIFGLMFWFRH